MAAITSEELVTKPMYDAARQGLEHCLRLREKLIGYDAMQWPRPDVAAYVDEWQPRLQAMIDYYNLRKAMSSGPQL